ncbi:unnamed protein product [Ceutorhynchus assimilis]|uniref:Phosphatidylinositol N-acetylglucosaminyltransferase subunit H conserved domain-containing protein n=1 Tax=Ceutorhynchus assimilis TaxID=467358 RepID=A0A9N9MHX2_9CUCU|nr:unnamed protein product [Ceutorhynchus assimilis]
MVKPSEKLHFKTTDDKNVVLNVMKSPACLCISIINDWKMFSSNEALSIGIFAIILRCFSVDMVYVAALLVSYLLYASNQILFCIREEEVLIVKGLGYQIKRKYFLKNTSIFIPYEQVQNVFINEVILRHKVIYILNFLVKGDEEKRPKIVPLFRDILPRLDCLEVIFRNIKYFQDR